MGILGTAKRVLSAKNKREEVREVLEEREAHHEIEARGRMRNREERAQTRREAGSLSAEGLKARLEEAKNIYENTRHTPERRIKEGAISAGKALYKNLQEMEKNRQRYAPKRKPRMVKPRAVRQRRIAAPRQRQPMEQEQAQGYTPEQIAQIREFQRQQAMMQRQPQQIVMQEPSIQQYQPRQQPNESGFGAFGTVFGRPASQQLWGGRSSGGDGTPADRLFGNGGAGNASQMLFSGNNASQGLWGGQTPSNMLFGSQGNASQMLFGGQGSASQGLWGNGGIPSQALFGGRGQPQQQPKQKYYKKRRR